VIKYISEDGELRFVLLDDDSQPREVKKLAKNVLRDLGILLEDDDAEEKPKPSGISQDDIKHLTGE
jgi:hypothetical protein